MKFSLRTVGPFEENSYLVVDETTNRGFFHHLRADTTAHVQHLRNGRVKHAGPGLAFWFRPRKPLPQKCIADRRNWPWTQTRNFSTSVVQGWARSISLPWIRSPAR